MKSHGLRYTRLYRTWQNMKRRCYCEKGRDYSYYGGRGIVVCDEWRKDFIAFYNWAMDNGYSDEHTLDRINVDGNYDPSNCRWATWEEQQNNKRNNVILEIDGVKKTISQWTKDTGIGLTTIIRRLSLGWQGKDLIKETKEVASKQSGIKGITWNKKKEKWYIRVTIDGKSRQIGECRELSDAVEILNRYKEEISVNER